jgi:FAD/FMN-containing dehydrogenase
MMLTDEVLTMRTPRGDVHQVAEQAIADFASSLRGTVLRPDDPGYEEARRVWNGMIDRRPALIARCHGAADVVAAVNFARSHKILVSVRGGGHQVAGSAVCDDGLVIDLSQMKGIHVNPRTRTARAQAGVTWGELDRETQLFGLATTGGEVSVTGIAGLTLGGGMGLLGRKYGLSCDNLISVDIVTSDGQLRTASEESHPDLFWAIRGGGRSLGVVTSFAYRLHPLGPEVMSATVIYPYADAGPVLRGWRAFTDQAPDEVTSEAMFWTVPQDPDFPPELHGQRVVIVSGLYAGPAEAGMSALQPLGQYAQPLVDLSGPVPYCALQSAFDKYAPDGLRYYWKSLYLDHLSNEAIEATIAHAATRPSPSTLLVFRHLGGAIGRVPENATAYGNRTAAFNLSIDSIWVDARESDRNIAWTRATWSAMEHFSNGGVYQNFAGFGEEGERLVRAAHRENYDRLLEVKRRYDPVDVFGSGLAAVGVNTDGRG